MIRAEDAIDRAKGLIGTPYAEMDCMALITEVIRRSRGGVKDYRCQGTNWLWNSEGNSGKYRHLIWRQEGLAGAKAGMLAFKRYGMDDVGHVGLVADRGMVIHASSAKGRGVVQTPLLAEEGWDLLGIHRYIEPKEAEEEEGMEEYASARVMTREDPLNLREAPGGRVIARIPAGSLVKAAGEGEWLRVEYEGMQGYAAAQYLRRTGEEDETGSIRMVIMDEAGNSWIPQGEFRVQMRRMED